MDFCQKTKMILIRENCGMRFDRTCGKSLGAGRI